MLPRTKIIARTLVVLLLIGSGLVASQLPSTGIPVQPNQISVQTFNQENVKVTRLHNFYVQTIFEKFQTKPFALVGITWTSAPSSDSRIQVKVQELGTWSSWYDLTYDADHAPDAVEQKRHHVQQGTDPLITGTSTGIVVRVLTKSKQPLKSLKVSLVNSAQTQSDVKLFQSARANAIGKQSLDSITTKLGAVVPRPSIVSRVQWGADESWRDPSPRIGEKIVAGFLHHTATTNSYQPEDGPAQMRDLYAYFIKVRKYSDIAYNFLVDKYGIIYEGRAGCSLNSPPACDGPSRPVIGGHTAGMNRNTFAVSAVGNFETTALSAATAENMVSAISSLMAWKLAKYNLFPSDIVKIRSTDTQGLSKYPNGAIASVPVISGHRDVGKTVCPGKYLYPYLPEIRARMTGLLTGKIQNLVISPTLTDASGDEPVTLTAELPPFSSWTINVLSANTGLQVETDSGIIHKSSNFTWHWKHVDTQDNPLAPGDYAISISATIGQQQLPTETTMVTLGSVPGKIKGLKLQRLTKNSVVVSWPIQDRATPETEAIVYRTSSDLGKTWTDWIKLPAGAGTQTISSLISRRKIFIDFRQQNAFGLSQSRQVTFISKS